MKKTYLAWIFSATDFYKSIIPSYFLLNKLSENFNKIYLINLENLKIFKGFHSNESKLEITDHIKKKFSFRNDNVEYFCPKDKSEFKIFMQNKKIYAISNLGRYFSDIPIHLLMSKYDIKLFQVSFVGNIQETSFKFKNIFRFIIYFFNKNISYKIITILSILGIVPKVEIRFTSISSLVNKKNFLRKLLEFFKISYVKKYILVNSRSYDMAIEKKNYLSQENIIYLDPMINNVELKAVEGNIDQKNFSNHYYQLKKFLKKIEFLFKKKKIIFLHPRDNFSEKEKIFEDFKVVQHETGENILKSSLVIFFETSAIIDAIIFKKKLLTLYSNFISSTFKTGADRYVNKLSILQININDIDKLEDYNKINSDLEKSTLNYDKYIKENIKPDTDEAGHLKIIRVLKKEYLIS